MNGFVTTHHLERQLDIPVELAATKLKKSDWLVVSTVRLQPGMTLSFRFAQLQISDIVVDTAVENSSSPVITSARSRGLAYIAIFKDYVQGDPQTLTPQGSTPDTIVATGLGIFSRATETELVITPTAVASYSVIVVNNTTNSDLIASVSSQLRIDLGS